MFTHYGLHSRKEYNQEFKLINMIRSIHMLFMIKFSQFLFGEFNMIDRSVFPNKKFQNMACYKKFSKFFFFVVIYKASKHNYDSLGSRDKLVKFVTNYVVN